MMTAEFMLSKRPVLRFAAALFFLLKTFDIIFLHAVDTERSAADLQFQNCSNQKLPK